VGHEHIFPTTGDIKDYFTTDCDYVKAKKAYDTTTALPSWMTFYEGNYTFLMYPPTYTAPYTFSIQVFCCSSIEECAIDTFTITIADTAPVEAYTIPDYTIQYDTAEAMGEHWDWALTSDQFTDADTNADAV